MFWNTEGADFEPIPSIQATGYYGPRRIENLDVSSTACAKRRFLRKYLIELERHTSEVLRPHNEMVTATDWYADVQKYTSEVLRPHNEMVTATDWYADVQKYTSEVLRTYKELMTATLKQLLMPIGSLTVRSVNLHLKTTVCREAPKELDEDRVPTDVSAADLVTLVTTRRKIGTMAAAEASDLLFPLLFVGTVSERRSVFATLRMVATPDAIFDTAFRAYGLMGYEDYLNQAASLLSAFGKAAWPTIRRWAQLGGAECESLVETAFSIEGVPDTDYLAGLKDLICKGDHNTRSRALGVLHMVPRGVQKELLTLIAHTGESDDSTRSEAEERLADEEMV
jgi:hypothetical protein